MSRSFVQHGKLWSLLERYDRYLRRKLDFERDKRSFAYELDTKGKKTILKLKSRLPFSLSRLKKGDLPLYFSFNSNPTTAPRPFKELEKNTIINIPSKGFPTIQIPQNIINAIPEIRTNKKIYLFEKIIDNKTGEERFYPHGSGATYLISFQIEALRNFWNEITDINRNHKAFLNDSHAQLNCPDNVEILSDKMKNKRDWDENQKQAFEKISSRQPFIVLDGFAGSGKTEVIQTAIQNLPESKILVASHDHAVVDMLTKKYEENNSNIIFYRIGNAKKAIYGDMGKHHIINKKKEHISEIRDRVSEVIKNLKNQSDARYKILEEWNNFLLNEEGTLFLDKITINSARALFCTSGGLHYYIKKNVLDKFLPFDFCFIDEGSMIEFPYLIHASQFSHTNIIAGDKNLVQPLSHSYGFTSDTINALEELEQTFSSSNPYMFTYLKTQYRICPKIFSIIHETLYPNEKYDQKNDLGGEFKTAPQKPYLSENAISFIDITNEGPNVKQKHGVNLTEVEIINQILNQLDDNRNWINKFFSGKPLIWITSLYNNQLEHLKDKYDTVENLQNLNIKVETVRRFTGNEANVVIWSINYAPKSFLCKGKVDHFPKINPNKTPLFKWDYIYDVLTRVKDKLIIIGCRKVLMKISKQMEAQPKKYRKLGTVLKKIMEQGDTIGI